MILIFALGVILYGSLVLLPLFLQTLLGYSATLAGLAISPGGIGTLVCMPFVGYLVGQTRLRKMIAFGLAMLSVSMFMAARYTLYISFWDAAYPRIVMGVGLAFLFVPLATVMASFVPLEKIGTATGPVQPDAQHRRELRHRHRHDAARQTHAVPPGPPGREHHAV